jgi:hypothetical protein
MLIVKSITVMTVRCAACGHTWATDLDALPSDMQEKVRAAVQDDHQQHAHVRKPTREE